MTTREWYRIHEGWIGAMVLSLGTFAIGLTISMAFSNQQCISRINILQQAFTTTIAEKDLIINRLSVSTSNAADAAVAAVQESPNNTQDAKLEKNKKEIDELKTSVQSIQNARKH